MFTLIFLGIDTSVLCVTSVSWCHFLVSVLWFINYSFVKHQHRISFFHRLWNCNMTLLKLEASVEIYKNCGANHIVVLWRLQEGIPATNPFPVNPHWSLLFQFGALQKPMLNGLSHSHLSTSFCLFSTSETKSGVELKKPNSIVKMTKHEATTKWTKELNFLSEQTN